jgi:hypothetical protein
MGAGLAQEGMVCATGGAGLDNISTTLEMLK